VSGIYVLLKTSISGCRFRLSYHLAGPAASKRSPTEVSTAWGALTFVTGVVTGLLLAQVIATASGNFADGFGFVEKFVLWHPRMCS
jgi:hypothetical protein